MIETQVQIPDELFERAKQVATSCEWSFAEIVRRGLEQMVIRYPVSNDAASSRWKLPDAVDLGLKSDPFANPDWREESNLSVDTTQFTASSKSRIL